VEQAVIYPIRHDGHTLAGTLVGLVLAMLLWTALYRHTSGVLRMEKACRLRSDRAVSRTRALAWALTLLETGRPPNTQYIWCWSYSCRVVVDDAPGGTYVVTYTKWNLEATIYSVSVRPATEDDSSLPLAPQTFGQS